jgi:hypothetical protein
VLDIRKATATIAYRFGLKTQRAIQAMAYDYETGEWYCSQGDAGTGGVEDGLITWCAEADDTGNCRFISSMLCVDSDHPDTISILRRNVNGVRTLGIVTNWRGNLVWVPYRAGRITKTDSLAVPIFGGGNKDAHIDHHNQTVCIRTGTTFKLYLLEGDTLGGQIGKTLTGVDQPGPGQGFWTMKVDDDYHLFAGFGYGKRADKQYLDVRSFTTGEGYVMNARVLPYDYSTQEPESGIGLPGTTGQQVAHLGMSTYRNGKKQGVLVRLDPPPPEPPAPATVTMYVRPRTDGIWADSPGVLSPRTADGKTVLWDVKRPPGYRIIGVPVTVDGIDYVRVQSGRLYRTRYLTTTAPK